MSYNIVKDEQKMMKWNRCSITKNIMFLMPEDDITHDALYPLMFV